VHCRPSGEPFYVGKGCGNRAYILKRRKNPHYNNVVTKYGKENILVFTLSCASEQQAHDNEKWMIAWCKQQNYKLTNLSDGGEGLSNPSTEVRLILSSKKMGKKFALGIKHTPEFCALQSKNVKAMMTVAHRKHLSKVVHITWTAERRESMSKQMRGNKNALGNKGNTTKRLKTK
jgi:predicted GIY-YIG superfamily endonuclease